MSAPPSIFVSYAHADKGTTAAIVESLQGAGLTVWWDADIPLGPQWQDVLQAKLKDCAAFLVLIGQQGVSGWIQAEVGVALSRHFSRSARARLPIVPVLLDDTPDDRVPPFLSLFQFHRLEDARDAAQIASLATALRTDLFREYRKPQLPPELGRCPFPGLAPFEREHQAFFFGRHTDLLAALDKFSQRQADGGRIRWLRIEGNSGVGKSSLLRAGLIPALENGWLDLGATDVSLRVLGVMRPGRSPLFALAAVLARACKQPTERIEQRLRDTDFRLAHLFAECVPAGRKQLPLLVVDQLEELFTLTRDKVAERQRFDQLLAEAIDNHDLPLYLVTTLRSDFLGQFETAPGLNARRNNAAHYELLPVTEAGLRDIVLRSVELAGLRYSDDQLSEDIIDEARNEPGALPLVSNLLRLLCDDAGTDGVLQRARYKTVGGLGGALASSADSLLVRLGDQSKEPALRLLLALVEPGINTVNARRSISRRQAVASAGGGEPGEAILERLSGHPGPEESAQESAPVRLVLISPAESENRDDDQVDLIHETLLRTNPKGEPYWPTLWKRIEHTDFLATRTRLEQQASAWHKDPDTVPLARGRELRKFAAHRPGADSETLAYLDASVSQKKRNLRLTVFLLALVLLVGGFLAEGALWLKRRQGDATTAEADWSTVIVHWRLLVDWPDRPTLVKLPPDKASDCFQMGSPKGSGAPDEEPPHEVCLQEFYISKHEVTFAQYDAYALSKGERLPEDENWGRGDRPVINVSWDEARAYAQALSDPTDGLTCGLPSEAEWEYAARARSETPWYWGNDEAAAENYAWFSDNSGGRTWPVGKTPPNDFGLHDMAGNVWEWVEDCWHESYTDAPEDGRAWLEEDSGDCDRRVWRGGSWKAIQTSCVPPLAAGTTPASAAASSVFGWFAAPILPLITEPWLLFTDTPRQRRVAGRAAPRSRFFWFTHQPNYGNIMARKASLMGPTVGPPGFWHDAFCAAGPGTTIQTTCVPPIATGTTPTTATTTSVFGWFAAHIYRHLALQPIAGRAVRTYEPVQLPVMSAAHGLRAEAGIMKDGAGVSRPQVLPRAHSKAGGSLGPVYPEPPIPRCSALSQPPSKRPISSTIRLTCSY